MNEKTKPEKTTGLIRILKAFKYSLSGLGHSVRYEAAFRQEMLLFILLSPLAFLFSFSDIYRLLILLSGIVILIVELLNTAIEAVVDKASPEYHELARQAKDMGSAAVLLSFAAYILVWLFALKSL